MGVRCFMVEPLGDGRFRLPDGEVVARKDVQPGAMWVADWMGDSVRVNGDGPVLVVLLPDGREWMPGSRAANCPHLRDWVEHDCWCVHGVAPDLTVDKVPEPGRTTCTAGAGSIGPAGGKYGWHGFLQSGELVEV